RSTRRCSPGCSSSSPPGRAGGFPRASGCGISAAPSIRSSGGSAASRSLSVPDRLGRGDRTPRASHSTAEAARRFRQNSSRGVPHSVARIAASPVNGSEPMSQKLLKRVSAAIVACYAVGVALLWAFQRDLMYYPDQMPPVSPSHYAMLDGVREVVLETADGLELTAWYAAAPAGRPTVVVLPGNGGSLRNSRYRLKHFKDAQMGVLLVAYRGYSGNPGTPSEEGLYADARAALDWVSAHGVDGASTVVYGASLGSGVATKMAAERELGAVVLEAPYTSTVDVAALRFPVVPV